MESFIFSVIGVVVLIAFIVMLGTTVVKAIRVLGSGFRC